MRCQREQSSACGLAFKDQYELEHGAYTKGADCLRLLYWEFLWTAGFERTWNALGVVLRIVLQVRSDGASFAPSAKDLGADTFIVQLWSFGIASTI
jgi:hypothetical protein